MEYAIGNLDKYFNNTQKLMDMLKADIKDLALQQIHIPALERIPLFKTHFSPDFLKRLSRIVQVEIKKPMEVLLNDNSYDKDKNFYIVFDGSVEITIKTSETPVKILKKRDFFGEFGFITGSKRQATVRTLEFCELFVIKRSVFLELLKNAT
jgi:CRP-like cAMP-binding protein